MDASTSIKVTETKMMTLVGPTIMPAKSLSTSGPTPKSTRIPKLTPAPPLQSPKKQSTPVVKSPIQLPTPVSKDEPPNSTKSKKKPVSRSIYESIVASLRSKRSKKVPANRNIYETFNTPADGDGGGEAMPTFQMEEEENATYKERLRRHRKAREDEEKRIQLTKMWCSMLLALVIVLSALGLGIYLVASSGDEQPKKSGLGTHLRINVHYGYDWCLEKFGKKGDNKDDECVYVVPPPFQEQTNQACNHTIQCREYKFFAADLRDDLENQAEMLDLTNSTAKLDWEEIRPQPIDKYNRRNLLCGRTERPVCDSKMFCKHAYKGNESLYVNVSKPTWVDNCDEVSECWHEYHVNRDKFPKALNVVSDRKRCLDLNYTIAECSNSMTVAIVWLQHLHCEFNADHVANEFCEETNDDKPYPFRLWSCRECDGKRKTPDEIDFHRLCTEKKRNFTDRGQCWVACQDNSADKAKLIRELVPTGTACTTKAGKEGYCVLGTCLDVYGIYGGGPKDIMSSEECKRKKEKRRKRKRKFVWLNLTASKMG